MSSRIKIAFSLGLLETVLYGPQQRVAMVAASFLPRVVSHSRYFVPVYFHGAPAPRCVSTTRDLTMKRGCFPNEPTIRQ